MGVLTTLYKSMSNLHDIVKRYLTHEDILYSQPLDQCPYDVDGWCQTHHWCNDRCRV